MEVLQQAFPFDLIERFYNKYIGMNFLLQGRHPREKLSEVVVHQRELNKTLLYSQVNYMKFWPNWEISMVYLLPQSADKLSSFWWQFHSEYPNSISSSGMYEFQQYLTGEHAK